LSGRFQIQISIAPILDYAQEKEEHMQHPCFKPKKHVSEGVL